MYVTRSDPAPGVAQLTLDRPDRMNALSMDLARDLLDALEDVAAEDGIGAVILTGAGRGFCAGGDVKEMERNRDKTLAQRQDDLASVGVPTQHQVEASRRQSVQHGRVVAQQDRQIVGLIATSQGAVEISQLAFLDVLEADHTQHGALDHDS